MATSQKTVERQHKLIKLIALEPWQHSKKTLCAELKISDDTLGREFKALRARGYKFYQDKNWNYFLQEAGWGEHQSFDQSTIRQIKILRLLYAWNEGQYFDQIKSSFPEVLQYELNQKCEKNHEDQNIYEKTLSDTTLSTKTLEHDVDALKKKGLIVKTLLGRYRFNWKMSLPPLYLNLTEQTILRAALDVAVGTQPLAYDYSVLEGKIAPQIPLTRMRRQIVFVHGRRPWQHLQRTFTCHKLSKAIRNRQELLLIYRSGSKERAREIKVNPLGLVFHWALDNWYLCSEDCATSQVKTYSVDRILLIKETGRTYTPSEEFILEDFYQHCWGIYRTGNPVPVKLKFVDHPIVAVRLEEELKGRVNCRMTKAEDSGSIFVEDLVDGLSELKVWLRSFGPQVKVIAPLELKAMHLDDFRKMLEIYGEES